MYNKKGEANKSLLFIKNHNSSDCQQLPESRPEIVTPLHTTSRLKYTLPLLVPDPAGIVKLALLTCSSPFCVYPIPLTEPDIDLPH
jgi:hypothetical protein